VTGYTWISAGASGRGRYLTPVGDISRVRDDGDRMIWM